MKEESIPVYKHGYVSPTCPVKHPLGAGAREFRQWRWNNSPAFERGRKVGFLDRWGRNFEAFEYLYGSNDWLATIDEYIVLEVCPRTPYELEYSEEMARGDHRSMVEDAIEDGLPVPDEVLADYPDLDFNRKEIRNEENKPEKT